jgi:hypothetical protein
MKDRLFRRSNFLDYLQMFTHTLNCGFVYFINENFYKKWLKHLSETV